MVYKTSISQPATWSLGLTGLTPEASTRPEAELIFSDVAVIAHQVGFIDSMEFSGPEGYSKISAGNSLEFPMFICLYANINPKICVELKVSHWPQVDVEWFWHILTLFIMETWSCWRNSTCTCNVDHLAHLWKWIHVIFVIRLLWYSNNYTLMFT